MNMTEMLIVYYLVSFISFIFIPVNKRGAVLMKHKHTIPFNEVIS